MLGNLFSGGRPVAEERVVEINLSMHVDRATSVYRQPISEHYNPYRYLGCAVRLVLKTHLSAFPEGRAETNGPKGALLFKGCM